MNRGLVRLGAIFACLAGAAPARAQSQSCAQLDAGSTNRWTAPLAQRVSVQLQHVTLLDALERITATSGVRLSYSADMLPLARRVCLTATAVPLGDLLAALLRNTNTHPASAAHDHAAIVPDVPPTESLAVIVLEPVYASIDAAQQTQRIPGVRVVIVDQAAEAQPVDAIAAAVNHGAAGMWLWQQPRGAVVRYGSLRGASSFGAAAPKLYVDGIAVANPLLLSRASSDAIERIEIVRGPQGGALYGAGATGGVMNIVTRHGAGGTATRTQVRTSIGLAGSDYAAAPPAHHEHAFSTRFGDAARSVAMSVTAGGDGVIAPQTGGEFYTADASGRISTSNALLSATLRFVSERTAPARELFMYRGSPSSLAVQQYTLGTAVTITPDATWTHSAILGIDGYALSGLPEVAPWSGDTQRALYAAGENGIRTTARLNTTARRQLSDAALASVSVALEHTQLLQRGAADTPLLHPPAVSTSAIPHEAALAALTSQSSTGIGAQTTLSFGDRLSMIGALRLERGSSDSSEGHTATLPMLGGSYLIPLGSAALGLRGSWGRAIRWVQQPQSMQARLIPEAQTGVEAGVDLTYGRSLALHVTRFDQSATALMQRGTDTGAIDNSGWELETALTHRALSVSATAAVLDSRVTRIGDDYDGDLRTGDRMLGVPASTLGVTASWAAAGWSVAVTATRANDWIEYDRVALARAAVNVDQVAGAQLRSFWRTYDRVTHLSVRTTHMLTRNVSLILSGDNLLDQQIGAPDNITILPGRGLSVGVRASF